MESNILAGYRTCVINALRANIRTSILPLVNEMLEVLAQSKFVRGPVAAETWFTAARVYWRRGNVTGACAAMTRAVLANPLFVTGIPWRGIRRVGRKLRKVTQQTAAEVGAVTRPSGETPKRPPTLVRKVFRGWEISRCWIRYSLVGARSGVPGLVDFIFGNRFFSACQVPSELTALGEILAARRPERALEIGTAYGGTLLFLTRLASPQATIISVDLPGGKFGGGYSRTRTWLYKRFARRKQRLQLFQGDSHSLDMLGRVAAVLNGRGLDYLFIDGDHTYEGAKRDFELYAPLVRKGGVIALHDIVEHPIATDCEVSRFWNQIRSQYRHIEIINDRQQAWAGIGVLYLD